MKCISFLGTTAPPRNNCKGHVPVNKSPSAIRVSKCFDILGQCPQKSPPYKWQAFDEDTAFKCPPTQGTTEDKGISQSKGGAWVLWLLSGPRIRVYQPQALEVKPPRKLLPEMGVLSPREFRSILWTNSQCFCLKMSEN